MLLLRIMCLLGLFTVDIKASSHWIVTETGIQTKQNSPFIMNRPNDLIAFLNQDIRWHNTFAMYNELFERQMVINSLWSDLVIQSKISKHVNGNENCANAGDIQNLDWYDTVAEDGKGMGISEDAFKLDTVDEFRDTGVPDCKKISSLTYSMATFEHLESVIHRAELNGTPEATLPSVFTVWTVNHYGRWLSDILRKNTSSWLHYNLASIYWRIKGNVPKALECSRRAVHHAPKMYKSIPLLCMGSILHRNKMSEDAVVVLGAAVDHAPTYPLSHITLGKAYAVVGDFNNSIKHFNVSLKLHHNLEEALKYRSAVLCHVDMFKEIQYTQSTLNKLAEELRVYHEKETEWFQTHGAILMNMHHDKDYDAKNVENNCIKMEELTNLKITELQKDRDRNGLIYRFVNNRLYKVDWQNKKGIAALLIAYEFEKAIENTSLEAGLPNPNLMDCDAQKPRNKTEIQKGIGPLPVFPDDIFPQILKFASPPPHIKAEIKIHTFPLPLSIEDHLELAALKKADTGKALYPSSFKVNRNRELFDTDPEWPSGALCASTKSNIPESLESVHPVFLPFEHKGLNLKTLLTDKIGVPALEEHELPWHPPLCPTDRDLIIHTNQKAQVRVQMVSESIGIAALRSKLHMYVGQDKYELMKNKQDAEIGHRIHVAIQKKLASKWVLYTLASLYWRVRGNMHNTLNCLLTAKRSADTRYKDIVLVSLASVFLEMGLWEDSLNTVDEAYRMNSYEPSTNFLLAQLHMVRRQKSVQFYHMKQVLRVEPDYLAGHARLMLTAWACLHKQTNTLKHLGDLSAEKDDRILCTQTEPGMSLKCEIDGTNCLVTNRGCDAGLRTDSRTSEHMREFYELPIKSALLTVYAVKSVTFNDYLKIVPTERHDKIGHQKSFELMIETFTDSVGSCLNSDCMDGFDSNIRIEHCASELFHAEYLFLYVCLPQELRESDIQILTEMSSLKPSHSKVPDCRVPLNTDDDFFLNRILVVDTENWTPMLTLMQQFSALYHQYDFITMGSMIAEYIDTHPASWRGAALAARWCGAGGRGACAARCAAAAHALAPPARAHLALRPLVAALHMQAKTADAMEIAYLSFYTAPKSSDEAVILGFTHHYRGNTNEAMWLYQYALVFNPNHVPALSAHHIATCERTFGKNYRKTQTTT